MSKPILGMDFDGVIHECSSGWKGADVIPDPPVKGAFEFLKEAQEHFSIEVFSCRSHQEGGIKAMKHWFIKHGWPKMQNGEAVGIHFPTHKPQAMVSMDDRGICFRGRWPSIKDLLYFTPWNKPKEGMALPCAFCGAPSCDTLRLPAESAPICRPCMSLVERHTALLVQETKEEESALAEQEAEVAVGKAVKEAQKGMNLAVGKLEADVDKIRKGYDTGRVVGACNDLLKVLIDASVPPDSAAKTVGMVFSGEGAHLTITASVDDPDMSVGLEPGSGFGEDTD